MAKGFKKLVTLTGIAAAAVGLYYYLNEEDSDGKKKGENLMSTVRKYIPLNVNVPAQETEETKEETDDEEFFEEEETEEEVSEEDTTEAEEADEETEEETEEEVFVSEDVQEEKFVPLSETVKSEEPVVEVDSEDFFVSE